tara:strand:- start:1407 stop:1592 length:186 start_codon:yes stop_codon:yes gene_type:complete
MPRFQLGCRQNSRQACGIIYLNPLILGSIGAVAQLVEHFAGSEKVRSSILLSSTKNHKVVI